MEHPEYSKLIKKMAKMKSHTEPKILNLILRCDKVFKPTRWMLSIYRPRIHLVMTVIRYLRCLPKVIGVDICVSFSLAYYTKRVEEGVERDPFYHLDCLKHLISTLKIPSEVSGKAKGSVITYLGYKKSVDLFKTKVMIFA